MKFVFGKEYAECKRVLSDSALPVVSLVVLMLFFYLVLFYSGEFINELGKERAIETLSLFGVFSYIMAGAFLFSLVHTIKALVETIAFIGSPVSHKSKRLKHRGKIAKSIKAAGKAGVVFYCVAAYCLCLLPQLTDYLGSSFFVGDESTFIHSITPGIMSVFLVNSVLLMRLIWGYSNIIEKLEIKENEISKKEIAAE